MTTEATALVAEQIILVEAEYCESVVAHGVQASGSC